jgi:hypothetical protein
MRILVNDNNKELVLEREVTKYTSQSMHTSNKEVFKFRDGWREATNAELLHMGINPLDYIQQ